MMISREKIDIILAQRQESVTDFCNSVGFSRTRFYCILNSKNVNSSTAGRLAAVLGVDVTEIIE